MSDTIELLLQCDSGIKMGIDAIDSVVGKVSDDDFKQKLLNYKSDYNFLQDEIDKELLSRNVKPSDPNVLLKGFATAKTEIKLAINDSDATIADLITTGCHMGVKTLNKYLNRYVLAEDSAKELTKKLIRLMDDQQFDMRKYL